jgi:hypothetical protein
MATKLTSPRLLSLSGRVFTAKVSEPEAAAYNVPWGASGMVTPAGVLTPTSHMQSRRLTKCRYSNKSDRLRGRRIQSCNFHPRK